MWETPKFFSGNLNRLIDCFSQDWNACLDTHHFYYVYSSIKREVKTCDCLCLIRNIYVRKVFARLRIGMFPLR